MGTILPPDIQREVDERVASGFYPDAEAVVRAAFESLHKAEWEYWAPVRREIQRRCEELESGKVKPITAEEVFASIRQKSIERRRKK